MTTTELQHAMDRAKGALVNKATITNIVATDAAQSERSVPFAFTAEESAVVFQAVLSVLTKRVD